MKYPIQEAMEQEMERKRINSQAAIVTDFLMMALNIPEGRHLVLALEAEGVRNNREALLGWVKQRLPEYGTDNREIWLRALRRELDGLIEYQLD